MRVLSLTYEYPPIGGGGSVVAAALNEALVAEGDEVEVVTCAMADLPRHELVHGVQVFRTPCRRRYRHYTTAWELLSTILPAYRKAAELIERRRPDVIHTHFALPSGVVAWMLARRYNVPYVLTAHGSDIPGYNPDRFRALHVLLLPLWRKVMRGAALVVSPSEFLARLIRRSIELPIRVIPNGYVPPGPAPPPDDAAAKKNLVLVVARLFPRKGVQYFIESLRTLASEWEFVIAGDGPYLETLQQQARESGERRLRFVGFIDKQALHLLYRKARILVFPSLRENFPMVLLEAMDAGCAVITTDAEGCAEVVGETGIVTAAGSAPQIRAALDELMGDRERCDRLARAARVRVELFRWPRIAALYRNVFREVTGTATMPMLRPVKLAAALLDAEPRRE